MVKKTLFFEEVHQAQGHWFAGQPGAEDSLWPARCQQRRDGEAEFVYQSGSYQLGIERWAAFAQEKADASPSQLRKGVCQVDCPPSCSRSPLRGPELALGDRVRHRRGQELWPWGRHQRRRASASRNLATSTPRRSEGGAPCLCAVSDPVRTHPTGLVHNAPCERWPPPPGRRRPDGGDEGRSPGRPGCREPG